MAVLKWALLGLLGLVTMAEAQAAPDEASLRAAMVYNLMLFVDWPADALKDSPDMLLCVVSSDHDVARAFTGLSGKTLKSRTLRVQRRGLLANVGDCNAVYLNGLDAELLADKLGRLGTQPVLTLSSSSGSGAMIDLSLVDSKLVFDVSAARLRDARLSLAARVMQLARTVRHQ